jgi:hypothetical protein
MLKKQQFRIGGPGSVTGLDPWVNPEKQFKLN